MLGSTPWTFLTIYNLNFSVILSLCFLISTYSLNWWKYLSKPEFFPVSQFWMSNCFLNLSSFQPCKYPKNMLVHHWAYINTLSYLPNHPSRSSGSTSISYIYILCSPFIVLTYFLFFLFFFWKVHFYTAHTSKALNNLFSLSFLFHF